MKTDEARVAEVLASVLRGLGSQASRTGYKKDWTAFCKWLASRDIGVLAVEPDHVEHYIFDLLEAGKAKATRARALAVLREVYRALVVKKLVVTNPAREVKNPKYGGTQRTPFLTESELDKILGYTGDSWRARRDRMCVQLLAGLGWRRTEIARMRVEDFRGTEVTGVVKGGKQLSVRVPSWLLMEVEAWKRFANLDKGPILPREAGGKRAVSGDIVYKRLKQVALHVGVAPDRVTPHALRRTLATLAEKRDVPLVEIQHSLGHSSIVTTERYLKGSREVERAPGDWMSELVKRP